MIGTIPIGDEAQRARVDKLKAMTPAKIAPLAVALASEAGKQVSGQIFAVRNNEIFLMGQSRPVRSVHTAEGWTPEGVVDTVFPSLQASFFPLDRSADIAQRRPRPDRVDAVPHGLIGHPHQLFPGRVRGAADDVHARGIAVPAVDDDGNVDVQNILVDQLFVV